MSCGRHRFTSYATHKLILKSPRQHFITFIKNEELNEFTFYIRRNNITIMVMLAQIQEYSGLLRKDVCRRAVGNAFSNKSGPWITLSTVKIKCILNNF